MSSTTFRKEGRKEGEREGRKQEREGGGKEGREGGKKREERGREGKKEEGIIISAMVQPRNRNHSEYFGFSGHNKAEWLLGGGKATQKLQQQKLTATLRVEGQKEKMMLPESRSQITLWKLEPQCAGPVGAGSMKELP